MRFAKVSPKSISGLPYGYTEIAYIETNGTQYIDTGVNAKTGLTVETVITHIAAGGILCGALTTTAGSGDRYYALNMAQGSAICFTYMDAAFSGKTNLTIGKQYTFKTVLGQTRQEIFVNGVSTGYTEKTVTANLGLSLAIFCVHRASTFNPQFYDFVTTRMYGFKIWDGTTLVRNMIPALDSTGKPCMYDKVEGKPYYNSGSGADFTAGPTIVPISYLQSTGTQYCDTLYPMADIGKIDLIIDWREHTTSRREIMGSASSGGYCFEVSTTGYYGVGATNYSTIQVGPKDKVTWTWAGEGNKPELYINDVFATRDSLVRVPVGNFMTAITDSWATNSKIYSIKIWNLKGELVRDIIPIRNESGTGYLFDKITHAFFGNQISGAFILGDDTAPKSVAKIIKSACTVSGLPYGYTEVEYLESSGTQYIDTEVIYQNGYNIESYFTCDTSTASSKFLFGVYGNGSLRQCAFSTYRNWNTTSALANFYYGLMNQTVVNKAVNKVELKNKVWYYNDTAYGDAWDFDASENLTMYLFAGHTAAGTNPNYYFIGKIHSFKMYNTNNTLIRDYIPALDTNGKPCLYDKVTAKPYYNKGTGEFTYGPKIIPVEYLESTGEQYIDTEYIPTTKTKWEFDFQYTSIGTFCANGSLANSPSTQRLVIGVEGNRKANMSFGGDNITNVTLDTNRHLFTIDCKNMSWSIDSNTGTYTTEVTDLGTNSIYFFARNRGTPQYPSIGKLYSSKLWDNSVLVRDYIPVKDENNVGYMFDRLSHSLYANAGSGSFTLGNDIACGKTKILGSESLVPKEYRQVEYIQSSESQWIDTGVYGNLNIMGYVDLEPSAASPKYPIGSGIQSNLGYWGICFQSIGSIQYYIGDGSYANPSTYTQGTRYKILINDNKKFYLDNELVVDYNTYTTKNYTRNNTKTIILFGFNWSSISLGSFKFYNCKLWDNGILIRNFIPVVRKSDSKPGMYDRVNGVFYTNQGSGADFTYPSS